MAYSFERNTWVGREKIESQTGLSSTALIISFSVGMGPGILFVTVVLFFWVLNQWAKFRFLQMNSSSHGPPERGLFT